MVREKDVVLIYYEDKPMIFARIEDIQPDIKRDWYHVKLLMLQLPLQTVTWILRDAYIGGETFTMNGNRIRLEKIVCPEDGGSDAPENETAGFDERKQRKKVISFSDLRKRGANTE